METLSTTRDHPVLTCAAVIGAALDEVGDVDPMFMSTAAKQAALVELSAVLARVEGLLGRVLANAGDVAVQHGSRSVAAWVAHRTRAGRGTVAAAAGLGEALDRRWRHVQAGVLAGAVNIGQARVIVHALDELPEDLDPAVLAQAEAHLVAQAAHFDPKALRVLGRRVLEVVAPDLVEDQERTQLEDEERRARQATSLVLRRRGDGTTDIKGRVSDAVAARLKTYLDAYAAPRRDHLGSGAGPAPESAAVDPETGRRVPYPVRLGRAFAALLEQLPGRSLPTHGGSATTVVVNVDLEGLRSQLGAAGFAGTERVSAAEALRLACTADIVPVVLGGQGQPLHLGRARRLFSRAQRLAMTVRDGGCRADGCDIPAAWCEAHHGAQPWSRGGKTDLGDGVLLCSWHHHRAHDPDYLVSRLPNGDLRYHRRT